MKQKSRNMRESLPHHPYHRDGVKIPISKPAMERRRRSKTNEVISRVRMLIQPSIPEEVSRQGRMERADILDSTVEYVKKVNSEKMTFNANKDGHIQEQGYIDGFYTCLADVLSVLDQEDPYQAEIRAKLCGFMADVLEQKLNEGAATSEKSSATSAHTGAVVPPGVIGGNPPIIHSTHYLQPQVQPQVISSQHHLHGNSPSNQDGGRITPTTRLTPSPHCYAGPTLLSPDLHNLRSSPPAQVGYESKSDSESLPSPREPSNGAKESRINNSESVRQVGESARSTMESSVPNTKSLVSCTESTSVQITESLRSNTDNPVSFRTNNESPVSSLISQTPSKQSFTTFQSSTPNAESLRSNMASSLMHRIPLSPIVESETSLTGTRGILAEPGSAVGNSKGGQHENCRKQRSGKRKISGEDDESQDTQTRHSEPSESLVPKSKRLMTQNVAETTSPTDVHSYQDDKDGHFVRFDHQQGSEARTIHKPIAMPTAMYPQSVLPTYDYTYPHPGFVNYQPDYRFNLQLQPANHMPFLQPRDMPWINEQPQYMSQMSQMSHDFVSSSQTTPLRTLSEFVNLACEL